MKIVPVFLCLVTLSSSAQQKRTFDLATYTVTVGWKETSRTANVVSYAVTDNVKGTYGQIGIYASTSSKGSLQADFESEWQELIVKAYHPNTTPQLTPAETRDGWSAQAGAAPFQFSGAQSAAMLVTTSGYGRCVSIVVLTNTNDYEHEIRKFLESVELAEPGTAAHAVVNNSTDHNNVQQTENFISKPTASGAYRFSTTNFDDGWIGTVQEDWVQVVKGNVVALIHFNTHKVDVSSSDHATISNNAWNTLVAPRYSNLSNYHVLGVTLGYEQPSLISGEVTDNRTGKRWFVSLFKKGKSGWIEIICPDRQTFINSFGVDGSKVDYYADDSIWNILLKLPGYNKFAVDAADLKGKWTSNFASALQYVNAYTGANAGMSTHSSNEKFEFGPGNTYKWDIGVASGFVGNLKFQGAKSTGTFSLLNNWQISFSDIEGKPKTYSTFFSCVKGGRILWLDDTGYARMD